MKPMLDGLKTGDIVYIQQTNDSAKYVIGTLSANINDQTGYERVSIEIDSVGAAILDGADIYFTVSKASANVASIKEAKVILAEAALKDLLANPGVILPAPGANKVIKILAISGLVDFNSISYDFVADLVFKYETSGVEIAAGAFADWNGGVTSAFDIEKSGPVGGNLSLNEGVTVTTATDATVGNSPIKLIVLYTEQDFTF